MILRQYCCPYSLHCGLDIWDLLTTHGKFVSLNSFDSKPPGFPGGSAGKESACSAGDLGSIPGLGRSPEEGNGCPLQYAGLEDSMDCKAHGVAKSQTLTEQLSLSLSSQTPAFLPCWLLLYSEFGFFRFHM